MPNVLDGIGNSMLGKAMEQSLGTAAKPAKSLIPMREVEVPDVAVVPVVEAAPVLPTLTTPPAPVVAEPIVPPTDPYAPLKQRLGERPIDEWLSEVDVTAREKDEALAHAAELEDRYKQVSERLTEYDVKYSPDYQENVEVPLQKAAKQLVFLLGDRALAEQVSNIWDATVNSVTTERRAQFKEIADEQGISLSELNRTVEYYKDTLVKGEHYVKNWEQNQKTKQAAQLREMEETQKAAEATQLRMRRTGIYAAEARVKELGIPHLEGFEEASKAWEKTVIDAQSGRPIDYNAEVAYSIIGRIVMANLKDFKGSFKELEDFKAATRSNPTPAVPKEKPVSTISDNPLLSQVR